MRNSFKLRNLSIAALAGLASFGAGVNSAQAEETPVVQTLGEASAYTLTKLETEPSSITSNVITNYVYDDVSGSLNKEYYRYDLAKTEYGSGANTRYYKWVDGVMTRIETDANGNPLETPEITVKNPNSGACMWRPNNQTVNGHWYVDQNGSTLDGWGSTSSPFKSNVINSYFIESSATGVNGQTNHGGAIRGFSMSEYTGISGTFIGNHATASGGAIYNYAQYTYNPEDAYAIIGDINADFIGNYVNDTTGDFMEHGGGGAIFNSGIDNTDFNVSIGDINGNFIRNYTTSSKFNQYGGAIQNMSAEIGNITGDFVENYNSVSASNKNAKGGAIYNGAINDKKGSTIGNITGDFVGNYAKSTTGNAYGGAIYNAYESGSSDKIKINSITGNFVGNYAMSESGYGYGGAIYNNSIIGNISGDFIGNHSYTTISGGAYGGAIYNARGAEIGDITGNFIGNYAHAIHQTVGLYADGGAIDNYGSIGNITGNFINNESSWFGGAIYNNDVIGKLTGDFIGNKSGDFGGAIYNWGTIEEIKGNFIENSLYSPKCAYGGAIANENEIGNVTGDFIGNSAVSILEDVTLKNDGGAYGGAIYNFWIMGDVTGNFVGNYAKSNSAVYEVYGGAIYNYDEAFLGSTDEEGNLVGGIINSSFYNNYAVSTNSLAKGGAVMSEDDLNIIAKDGYTSVFSGNYVEDINGKRPEAIHMTNYVWDSSLGSKKINGTNTKVTIYQNKKQILLY